MLWQLLSTPEEVTLARVFLEFVAIMAASLVVLALVSLLHTLITTGLKLLRYSPHK